MARRVRQPETKKLDLLNGDWLLVKDRLNAGEYRTVQERQIKSFEAGGRLQLDIKQIRHAYAVMYLLDWGEFFDANGNPLVIRDKSPDEIGSALDALDQSDYEEVVKAIEQHIELRDREVVAEKNGQSGKTGSTPILSSADL